MFQSRVYLGISTLKELILKRPSRQFQYLNVLLNLSSHEKEKVQFRSSVLNHFNDVYVEEWHNLDPVLGAIHCPRFYQAHVWERTSEGLCWEVRSHIHAVSGPPESTLTSVWSRRRHRCKDFSFLTVQWRFTNRSLCLNIKWFAFSEVAASWTEETVRQCLYLYLSLLPLNHRLVHELASVYTEAIADIKRSVLRVIEQPVRRSLNQLVLSDVSILWGFNFMFYV